MDMEIQTPKKRTTKGSMLQGVEGIHLWGPERNVWGRNGKERPFGGIFAWVWKEGLHPCAALSLNSPCRKVRLFPNMTRSFS